MAYNCCGNLECWANKEHSECQHLLVETSTVGVKKCKKCGKVLRTEDQKELKVKLG